MSGEFSALQEEEGEEEQEFADDPILQLDMKVRPQSRVTSQCTELYVSGTAHTLLYVNGTAHTQLYVSGSAHTLLYVSGTAHTQLYVSGTAHTQLYVSGTAHTLLYVSGTAHTLLYVSGTAHTQLYVVCALDCVCVHLSSLWCWVCWSGLLLRILCHMVQPLLPSSAAPQEHLEQVLRGFCQSHRFKELLLALNSKEVELLSRLHQ